MSWAYQDLGKMEAEIEHIKHSTKTITEIINRWSQTYTHTTYVDYDELKDFKVILAGHQDELTAITSQIWRLARQTNQIRNIFQLPLWQNYGKDKQ